VDYSKTDFMIDMKYPVFEFWCEAIISEAKQTGV